MWLVMILWWYDCQYEEVEQPADFFNATLGYPGEGPHSLAEDGGNMQRDGGTVAEGDSATVAPRVTGTLPGLELGGHVRKAGISGDTAEGSSATAEPRAL